MLIGLLDGRLVPASPNHCCGRTTPVWCAVTASSRPRWWSDGERARPGPSTWPGLARSAAMTRPRSCPLRRSGCRGIGAVLDGWTAAGRAGGDMVAAVDRHPRAGAWLARPAYWCARIGRVGRRHGGAAHRRRPGAAAGPSRSRPARPRSPPRPWLLAGREDAVLLRSTWPRCGHAAAHDADDVIFVGAGRRTVLEAPTATVVVARGRTLLTTPPADGACSAGITARPVVRGRCGRPAGRPTAGRCCTADDLRQRRRGVAGLQRATAGAGDRASTAVLHCRSGRRRPPSWLGLLDRPLTRTTPGPFRPVAGSALDGPGAGARG